MINARDRQLHRADVHFPPLGEVERLTRLYAMLSQVGQAIVRCDSREMLLHDIGRVMLDRGGYLGMCVAELPAAEDAPVVIVGQLLNDGCDARDWVDVCDVVRDALRTGRVSFCNDTCGHGASACCREIRERCGVCACAGFPLRVHGETRWVLGVWASDSGVFQPEEVQLLEEVADDIALALDRLDEQERRRRAEDATRRADVALASLLDAMPDLIFFKDVAGTYVTCNPAFAAFVNRSREEIIGRTDHDLFPRDVADAFREQDHVMLESKRPRQNEEWVDYADGRRVLLHTLKTPYSGPDGTLLGVLGVSRDITARKHVEEAMRHQLELQDQLAKVAATVPGTIYSFLLRPDGATSMPFASAAIERLFGFTADQVRDDASNILQLVHPDDAAGFHESIRESARSLRPWRQEFRAVNTPRGELWIEGHSVPQQQSDGSVLWFGFLQDITERKAAERQVRMLSRAVEQSPVSIVITNDQGQIEYVNPKFTALTGYTPDEVLGGSPRILKSGATPPEEYARLWTTIRGGETWHGEFRNRKKNGETFSELATISPVTDDHGRITNFLAVKEDITERKQLEAQIRQSQKLEAIGQLAGGVAHDFNNILAAMMMQSELLTTADGLTDEVREGLSQIKLATERAAALTRQLLLFSRKQVLQPKDLDLNEVVRQLAKMLKRLIREDVHLDLRLQATPLVTHADAGMLDQLLMNLVVNARDAMPDGGRLTIETGERQIDSETARLGPDRSAGTVVWLRVADTGCGMTPEVLSHVFEPFFTTKPAGKGTGLGLATVFGIVKQHGGWITVQSEPGRGTAFEVFLPARRQMAVPADDRAEELPRGGSETILLVEDDDALRNATAALLTRHGYSVIEAGSGREALLLWEDDAGAIDLVVTDLVMPGGISGQELARTLRAQRPSLHVVFTSGYSSELAGTEVHVRGGDVFLQKPAAPSRLLTAVRDAIEAGARSAGL